MRVLFAGGGTAGHINPALAIAGYLREQEPDTTILYVGNEGGMEERLVPAAGFDFRTVKISGFQRKVSLKNIKRNAQTLVRIVTSSQQAKKIIRDFKPDICVGTGGYVSGPVIREAMKLGIPAVIHEQTGCWPKKQAVLCWRWQMPSVILSRTPGVYSPATRCGRSFAVLTKRIPAGRWGWMHGR